MIQVVAPKKSASKSDPKAKGTTRDASRRR